MANTGGDHDRVVQASRKADGTPDQTPDFTYIGDKETSIRATEEQLTQQRVSAEDVRLRGASTAGTDGSGPGEPDAAVKKIADAHEKAAKSAASDAKSEVEERFEDTAAESMAARRATGIETAAARGGIEDTSARSGRR